MNFHKRNIKKGEYGRVSKIQEEVLEYIDSMEQESKIMASLELADIYGALQGLAKSHNLSMSDLKIMSDITQKARFKKPEHLNISSEDISLILDSVQYVIRNFSFVECKNLPWHVSDDVMKMTYTRYPHQTMDGNFVGSAEQSFLQLMLDNKLDKNLRYVGFSPCLRNEKIDNLHDRQFYKAELFSFSDYDYLDTFISVAEKNIKEIISDASKIELEKKQIDDDSFDLLLNGIEIGSYCRREFENYKWVCGTLLAMPRFRIAFEKGLNG